jgi:hypothetical protein
MKLSPILRRQTGKNHTLQSLLLALSFTSPLQTVYVQSIVAGFVQNVQFYIGIQKFRGWLAKQDGLILLTKQAQGFVRLSPFSLTQSKPDVSKQTYHELLLVRSLFLCLLHLNFDDITEIRKQKYYETRLIPDLTIVTEKRTLLIEIDRGKQPSKTLEAKIRELRTSNPDATIIYFTDAQKTYDYLTQSFERSKVQCIHLQSPTLAQDLLNLTAFEATVETDADYITGDLNDNLNLGVNPAPQASDQSSDSKINDKVHKTATTSKPKFQPIELTSPVTGKPIKTATIALAPNVFVFDSTLVKKMAEPWSEEYVQALKNLKSVYKENTLHNNQEDTLTDTLRLLEQEGYAEAEDDLDD